MKIPPHYVISKEMLELLSAIEVVRIQLESQKLPGEVAAKIRRVSLLKSSLFSARIEGNPLHLNDLHHHSADKDKKKEVFNIEAATKHIHRHIKKGVLTEKILRELHLLVMKGISSDAGRVRREMSAIFSQAGIAIYVPPPPAKIKSLLDELLVYINSDRERFPLIAACISHLVFEKIHPFLDGNGRVGRLLITSVLRAKGWNLSYTVPFEVYLDDHKDEYYHHLDVGMKETNEYLMFMLRAFLDQLKDMKSQTEETDKENAIFLPPRQEEIYTIIKEHTAISFDMIRRRFLKVPERTLRYELKKLAEKKLIEKTGTTKGSYYRAMREN